MVQSTNTHRFLCMHKFRWSISNPKSSPRSSPWSGPDLRLYQLFHSTVGNSAIIAVPSEWLNSLIFISRDKGQHIAEAVPYNVLENQQRILLSKNFTWWAGFWRLITWLFVSVSVKRCGIRTMTMQGEIQGLKHNPGSAALKIQV